MKTADRTIVSKVINGFTVEVENDPSVEWSDCYIVKGGYSGTLTFLEDHGELINDCGSVITVAPHTIKLIRDWAEDNGY
jgi:hypothetical protein